MLSFLILFFVLFTIRSFDLPNFSAPDKILFSYIWGSFPTLFLHFSLPLFLFVCFSDCDSSSLVSSSDQPEGCISYESILCPSDCPCKPIRSVLLQDCVETLGRFLSFNTTTFSQQLSFQVFFLHFLELQAKFTG